MANEAVGRIRPEVLRAAAAKQGHSTVVAFCSAHGLSYPSVAGVMTGRTRRRQWCLVLADKAGVSADRLFEWVAP